jgi:NodT family efflux transporter outer membrane factor (OMF) lipoprotein
MRIGPRPFPVIVAAAILAGCALQPPPKPSEIQAEAIPNVQIPQNWIAAAVPPGTVTDDWLMTFGDNRLEALVNEAIIYNLDLRIAAVRVEQAAAYAKLAGATIYPVVNFLGHGGGKSGGDGSGLNVLGLFASWELDIWGRARAEREVGRLQYEAVVADSAYARQSIAAMVAKAWLLAIEAHAQLAFAQDVVRLSEQSVGLAQDRLRVGNGDEYDVALGQASLETSRDAVRQLTLGYQQALRALEVLIGRYPAAGIDVPVALPNMPPPVPVGLPSELLERRPDVIAAERRVAAAFNNVAEAKAARLPRISLTASATAVSSDLVVLQSHANPVLSLGGSLLAPIFSGFALEAQVDIRTAEQKLAIAQYGTVAQRAFGEVEGALSAEFAADEREALLARSVASNARALELAQVRYKVGSSDLRAVLQQSVALYGARTTLLHVQNDRRIQRVNLYLALGGNFEKNPATASAEDKRTDAAAAN